MKEKKAASGADGKTSDESPHDTKMTMRVVKSSFSTVIDGKVARFKAGDPISQALSDEFHLEVKQLIEKE